MVGGMKFCALNAAIMAFRRSGDLVAEMGAVAISAPRAIAARDRCLPELFFGDFG
jgi:hypothetical protein